FRDQVARRRVPSRKGDPRLLADQAAPPIAAHEVAGPKRPTIGERDVDTALVLREARHRAPTKDWHRELGNPVGENPFDAVLREDEPMVVASRKVADIERNLR